MSGVKPTQRTIYFDVLNIIACICVIFLHHNTFVHSYNPQYKLAWAESLAVEVVAYFAVPIFLMLTGATLMEYRNRYDTKTFFKKRFARVVIPFVIWVCIALLIAILQHQYAASMLFTTSIVWNALMSWGVAWGVYWFLPVIIAIYLSMPILSLLTSKADRKWLWYIVIAGLATYSVIPPLVKMAGLSFNTAYGLPLVGGGFMIYPILGYLLSTTEVKTKWLWLIIIGAVGAWLLRYLVTYFLTVRNNATNDLLFDYTYFTAVIPSVAVFLVAKRIPWSSFITGRWELLLAKISACSLGIYLMHIFVLQEELRITGITENRFLFRIVMPIFTYLTCLMIVFWLRRTPVFNKIFP